MKNQNILSILLISGVLLTSCTPSVSNQSTPTSTVKASTAITAPSGEKAAENPPISEEVAQSLQVDNSERIEPNPPISEEVAQSLLIDNSERVELNPPISEEVAQSLLIDNSERVESNPPISEEVLQDLLIDNSERVEPNPPLSEEVLQRILIPDYQEPIRVRLDVAPQIQQVWNYCAPTTVSMMLSARGVAVDQYQLARDMGTYEPFGTHNRDAIRFLNRYLFGYDYPADGQAGYRLATVTDASPTSQDMALFKQRLIQNIKDGYPMYYTFDVSKIYPGLIGEHNVIGTGYELTADGSDIAYVYYLDPSPNVQDPVYGGLKKVTPEVLLDAMMICIEPNYGW